MLAALGKARAGLTHEQSSKHLIFFTLSFLLLFVSRKCAAILEFVIIIVFFFFVKWLNYMALEMWNQQNIITMIAIMMMRKAKH